MYKTSNVIPKLFIIFLLVSNYIMGQNILNPTQLIEKICNLESKGDASWRVDYFMSKDSQAQDSLTVDYDMDKLYIINKYDISSIRSDSTTASFWVTYNLCAATNGIGIHRKLVIARGDKKFKVIFKKINNNWKVISAFPIGIMSEYLLIRLKERQNEFIKNIPEIENERTPRGWLFQRISKDIQFLSAMKSK